MSWGLALYLSWCLSWGTLVLVLVTLALIFMHARQCLSWCTLVLVLVSGTVHDVACLSSSSYFVLVHGGVCLVLVMLALVFMHTGACSCAHWCLSWYTLVLVLVPGPVHDGACLCPRSFLSWFMVVFVLVHIVDCLGAH
ncbi:unnamed protein product [Sphenostylis stenocarpa]|uniref:Uncharacterized protein n=1 Tax=Sphenostylis stenocarpa TaxID=92480 RepID=A0AA86SN43_9FABA|nr:unnamed protein product [Sphenostylis stenocarpa]